MLEFFRTWVLPELLTILGFLLALVFFAGMLKPRHPPTSATAWLLLIFFLPYLGVPLFLMFGGRKLKSVARKKARVYRRASGSVATAVDPGIERILASYGVPPRCTGNHARIAGDGVLAYEETLRLIDASKHEIHALYYIIGMDEVGGAIIEHLAARARDGVKVRLLLDAIGCWRVRRSFVAPLVEAGGEVQFFMPMFSLSFRSRANLRNHRKILVCDERVAIVGGMNLAAEYMGPTFSADRWLDFACTVEGPVVKAIAELFRSDWEFATTRQLEGIPRDHHREKIEPSGTPTDAQLVASGPDVDGDPLYDALIAAFYRASKRIWVVTPYFVPDESLARSLELAARRGVDVRLVVPAHSNHLMADIARASYLTQVAAAGGKLLLYTPGMLHAKVMVIDDELAVIGSANMDMRSLFLNYEVALFFSSREFASEISRWIEQLFPDCQTSVPKPGRVRDMAEGVIRLVSPLL